MLWFVVFEGSLGMFHLVFLFSVSKLISPGTSMEIIVLVMQKKKQKKTSHYQCSKRSEWRLSEADDLVSVTKH